MGPLVVPMDPAFFPEAGLLVAGVFTGVAAIAYAVMRGRPRSEATGPDGARRAALRLTAIRLAAASLACFALVFVMARTLHGPPKSKPAQHGPRIKPEPPDREIPATR